MKYNAEFIGNTIRIERDKRNWSQKKLGDKLGITGKQVSKYEHGDPIPPIDVLLKLCEIFECELGYLLGEQSYSEGTKLQTAIHETLNLSLPATETIKKITGTNRSAISFGYQSPKFIRIINNLLSSPMFLCFVEAIGNLDDCVFKQKAIFDSVEEKYGKELFKQAMDMYYSSIDYEHDPEVVPLSTELCEIIKEISKAEDQGYALSYAIKVARYELQESFEDLITNLYPRN